MVRHDIPSHFQQAIYYFFVSWDLIEQKTHIKNNDWWGPQFIWSGCFLLQLSFMLLNEITFAIVKSQWVTQVSSPLFKTKWRPRMYVTKLNVSIVWHWSCFEIRQHFPISQVERPMFSWHEGQGPQQYSDTSISRCLSRYAWELFWLIGPCRMRGAIRNNSVFHVSYSRLALSLLCFFRALHLFFSRL